MTLLPTIINGKYYYRLDDVKNSYHLLSDNDVLEWIEFLVKFNQITHYDGNDFVTYEGVESYLMLYIARRDGL